MSNFLNKILWIILLLLLTKCQDKFPCELTYKDDIKDNSIGRYCNSLKDGLWVDFYENGQLKSIIFYIAGKANGPYKYYYSNGNVCIVTSMKNGKYYSEYSYYYSTGKINSKGNYNDNGMTGKWYYYTETGALGKIELYKNDKKIKILLDNKTLPALPNNF